jgi:hypothetical protein
VSGFWHAAFRVQYRILALIDPLVRRVWRTFGVGNILELRVAQRNGKGARSRLVGLLRVGDRRYLGHPNGNVGWTRDLEAAGEGILLWPDGMDWAFRATKLSPGPEREAVIRSTGQHPFPGNLMYRLGRVHVRRVGVFFRLEPS